MLRKLLPLAGRNLHEDMDSNENRHELEVLISLLDDPDRKVYHSVRDRIFQYGVKALPILEEAWDHQFNPVVQERLEDLIQAIQKENLATETTQWLISGTPDLLQGALLLARFHYPELNFDKCRIEIGRIIQDVWLELNDKLTPLEKVKVVNHVLFDVHGFRTNVSQPLALNDLIINNVLETKRGNSMSLSLLYLIVGQSLKLPIMGVNLPEYFALSWLHRQPILSHDYTSDDLVSFYINAPAKGMVFVRHEIERYLRETKNDQNLIYFSPCSNYTVIKRMAIEMLAVYERTKDESRVRLMKLYLESFKY